MNQLFDFLFNLIKLYKSEFSKFCIKRREKNPSSGGRIMFPKCGEITLVTDDGCLSFWLELLPTAIICE